VPHSAVARPARRQRRNADLRTVAHAPRPRSMRSRCLFSHALKSSIVAEVYLLLVRGQRAAGDLGVNLVQDRLAHQLLRVLLLQQLAPRLLGLLYNALHSA